MNLDAAPTRSDPRGDYEEYHPYGSTAWWAGASATVSQKRYRFTGMERDDETGLQCHGVRYYAVWLGRWVSADPIGLGDGVNRFGYCHGGVVGGRDSTGMETDPTDWATTWTLDQPSERVKAYAAGLIQGALDAPGSLTTLASEVGGAMLAGDVRTAPPSIKPYLAEVLEERSAYARELGDSVTNYVRGTSVGRALQSTSETLFAEAESLPGDSEVYLAAVGQASGDLLVTAALLEGTGKIAQMPRKSPTAKPAPAGRGSESWGGEFIDEGVRRPPQYVSPWSVKRTHSISGGSSTKHVARLEADMRLNGFERNNLPLLVAEHGGQFYVLDGHHRLLAAQRAGIQAIPVRVVDDIASFPGYRTVDDVVRSSVFAGPNKIRYTKRD